jgi:hypothetical protein
MIAMDGKYWYRNVDIWVFIIDVIKEPAGRQIQQSKPVRA